MTPLQVLPSIAEDHGISYGESSPSHPSSFTGDDDQLACALARGGSLEDFNSVGYVKEGDDAFDITHTHTVTYVPTYVYMYIDQYIHVHNYVVKLLKIFAS